MTATLNATICAAIRGRRLLMFAYGDQLRVVEPHAYGLSRAGNELLSAWMRPGLSRVDPEGGWRTYRVEHLEALQPLDEIFTPQPDYNPEDDRWAEVLCRVTRGGVEHWG